MRLVIVTGMSGAGKSTALKMLEDVGYFCVDNLPVLLIEKFADIATDSKFKLDKIAVGIDIRNGEALNELTSCLAELRANNFTYEILFLDASETALVKRYKETRRDHPLSHGGRINTGIKKEREKIAFLRDIADYIILFAGLIILFTVSMLQRRKAVRERLWDKPAVLNCFVTWLLLISIVLFGAYSIGYDSAQFIYNQF